MTSPRSTTVTSSPTPSASSEASISGRRPEVAMPYGTASSARWRSRSTAPGSGRRSGSSSRNSSPWRSWMALISSSLSGRPSSRARARVNRPPLIPIRRWIRQPSTGSPLGQRPLPREHVGVDVSISVPSRSKISAGIVRQVRSRARGSTRRCAATGRGRVRGGRSARAVGPVQRRRDLLAQRRPMLEAVPGAAAHQPHAGMLGVLGGDEVRVRRELVAAGLAADQRSRASAGKRRAR